MKTNKAEGFGSWPLHRLNDLVGSDDFVMQNGHRPGRDIGGVAECRALPIVVGGLCAGSAQQRWSSPLPEIVVSRLAAAASASHCGPSPGSLCEPLAVRKRKACPFRWADSGCSIRSGSVVADPEALQEDKRRADCTCPQRLTLRNVQRVYCAIAAQRNCRACHCRGRPRAQQRVCC